MGRQRRKNKSLTRDVKKKAKELPTFTPPVVPPSKSIAKKAVAAAKTTIIVQNLFELARLKHKSPYPLVKTTLYQLIWDFKNKHPRGKPLLQNHAYMSNFIRERYSLKGEKLPRELCDSLAKRMDKIMS